MIKIRSVPLQPETTKQLRIWQNDINGIANFEDRVEAAQESFKRENKPGKKEFKDVRECLTKMCPGDERCMYCEDSARFEIDHFAPKVFYPDRVFVWSNYIYACGACNRPKLNSFSIYSRRTGIVVKLKRGPKGTNAKPEPGQPLLINPRREDPLDFMKLVLQDSSSKLNFVFEPTQSSGRIHERALHTIEILHLNDRSGLRRTRQQAFFHLLHALQNYCAEKAGRNSDGEKRRFRKMIRENSHQTVWHEMKRQRQQIPKLSQLFAAAPEALSW